MFAGLSLAKAAGRPFPACATPGVLGGFAPKTQSMGWRVRKQMLA
jgi:hypothetical protein